MSKGLSFGQKVGGGFAATAILTVVIGAIAVYALRNVVDAKDEVIGLNAQLLMDAERVNVAAAETVVQNVNRGRGTLGRLTTDPTAANALEASLQHFEAITARIRDGEGTLGKFLTDDAFARSLSSTGANLDAITGRINRGEGTAGRLLADRELYDRLNSMSDRLDKVMAGLQDGQGTAGQLLHDRQLYENMNGAVGELRQLVRDIRADPRKFLNVRVSLF